MNLEYTSYVMSTSYLIENMLIKSKKNHKDTLQDINKKIHSITVKNRNDKNNELPKPDNLEFVDAEHDFQSGMTGVLFRDKTTKQLIMGFTGTNLENDFYNDAIKTDIGSILFGDGLHYQSAYDFYIRMIQKYGKPSVLTGHSLGGNYAHRVALHFNVPKAVVYNSAPLYVNLDKVEKVLTILLDAMTKGVALATAPSLNPLINVTNSFIQLLASLPSVTIAALIARTKIAKLIQPGIIKKINEDLKGFTGQIVRIRSKFDPLNAVSEAFDGFYVGKEYVFDDGLGHDQQGFLSEEIQDLVKTILAPNTRHHYPENQHSLTLEFVAKTLKDVIAPKRPNVNAHVPSIDGISKVGTDKNDSIIGTEKSESINGKAGNDTINGMGGNDVLLGGEGNDTIYGGDGQDWLYGWNGDDYLHGEWGDDTLIGGPGNDTLIGGMGNDEYVFQLGSGHDSIFDGDGTSFLNFRDGINLSNLRAFYTKDKQVALGYKNDSSSFVILKGIRDGERYQDVWIDTQDGSIHGSDKRSPLRDLEGTDGDDEMSPIYAGTRLSGLGGNDILQGSDENDILDGGFGKDTLSGGKGDDTYVFGLGYDTDVISDNQGLNRIKLLDGVSASDMYVSPKGNSVYLVIAKSGDKLYLQNFTYSEKYQKYLLEYANGQQMKLDDPNSPFRRAIGTNDSEWVSAVLDIDTTVLGLAGDDQLYGKGGNDKLFGGEGNDEIYGQAGDDYLYGETGNDKMEGGTGNDFLDGGEGDDRLNGEDDDDILYGAAGNDAISGGSGNDFLYGGLGNDGLYGNAGYDILDGEEGDDYLEGGQGDDTYIFGRGYGHDTIEDYQGVHTIKFLEGITPDDLYTQFGDDSNLNDAGHIVLRVKDSDDQLTIKNFRNVFSWWDGSTSMHESHRNVQLVFADGTTMSIRDKESPIWRMKSGNGDNRLYNPFEEEDYASHEMFLEGNNGNDTLIGAEKNDRLYGGSGNDELRGHGGNDLLDGGVGDDILKGGEGDDTYIFGSGYGHDTIEEVSGLSTIRFKDDIKPNDIYTVYGNKGDITLRFHSNADDAITLKGFSNYFSWWDGSTTINDSRRKVQLLFSDGSTMPIGDKASPVWRISGTDGNDSIRPLFSEDDKIVHELIVQGLDGNDSISGDDMDDRLYGGSGDDKLFGNGGDDLLDGGAGNDELNGDSGNDTLDGGLGNDRLEGGYGDDTYIFGVGYGKETIYDYGGQNKIKFLEGIRPSDLTVYASGQYDIVIKVKDGEDQITISSFRNHNDYRNFSLEFADGTILDKTSALNPLKVIQGTSSNDSISAYYTDMTIKGEAGDDNLYGSSGADTLYGGTGNDSLNGDNGNDFLDGGAGDDRLTGDYGNDILDGGLGNDRLEGGYGDDTYIFGVGYGKETIYDYGGQNKIKFLEGIRPSDLTVYASGQYDIVIKVKDGEDQITISSFRNHNDYRNFSLEFADGTILDKTSALNPLKVIQGTSSNDSISAYYTDMTIKGEAGDDNLYGSSGADTLYGGTGNDSLNGDNGNDFLDGDVGNDELNGGAGNDLLDGGTGNDQLKGGNGNDTYLFGLGSGNDTITDEYGTNKIKFINGIRPSDLEVYTSGQYDIVIKNKSTDDQLTIAYFRYGSSDRNFSLEFDDGTVLARDASSSPFKEIHGTSGNDSISAYFTDMTIRGGDGNDALHGSSGADRLYGDAGNDELNGGDGNDLLDGGTGNDQLKGGNGDDTYIFGLGYGQDTISDSEGLSTIRFGEGISPENLKLAKSDNWNLSLTQGDDQLILNNYFYSSSYRNVRLEFSDKRTATVNDQLMTLDVKAAPVSESAVTPVVQAQTLVTLVNDVASSNPVTNTSPLPQASTTEIRSVTQSQLLVQEVSALPSENTVSAVNSAANTNTNLFTEQLTVQ